jgi:asparagine synthase (glutamine-hydrolysing)
MMQLPEIARTVRNKNLTYLSDKKFISLYECVRRVRDDSIPGDFLEFGVALGGSAICLASELDDGRRFLGFDVFGMIPPPGELDGASSKSRFQVIVSGQSKGIAGEQYYGYIDDLYEQVKKNFHDCGILVDDDRIQLVKGLFHETLPLVDRKPIALAHIDCDWYEPVLDCLNFVYKSLSLGGYIILDDYNAWPGCTKATSEFVADHPDIQLIRSSPHAVLKRVA